MFEFSHDYELTVLCKYKDKQRDQCLQTLPVYFNINNYCSHTVTVG